MNENDMPKRLSRQVIYESDYVCLYADKAQLPSGFVIDKYHQIHYPKEAVSIVIFGHQVIMGNFLNENRNESSLILH